MPVIECWVKSYIANDLVNTENKSKLTFGRSIEVMELLDSLERRCNQEGLKFEINKLKVVIIDKAQDYTKIQLYFNRRNDVRKK